MTGRILVVCGAGASSTFLAQRLRALASADGLEVETVAGSVEDVRLDSAGMDVVLVGPHLADRFDAVRRAASEEGATAILLDAASFGPDGARAALDRALPHLRFSSRRTTATADAASSTGSAVPPA